MLVQSLWVNDDPLDSNSLRSVPKLRLRASSQTRDTASFISHMEKELLQDLCLGFDCDLEWEALPEDIRHYLIDRCLGISRTLTDDQKTFVTSRLSISAGPDLETYLACCDYAAFTGAIDLHRTRSRVGANEPYNAHQALHRTKSIVGLLASSNTPTEPSLKDKALLHSGNLYHGAGTIAKFFFVAFVADPEYQRELDWIFSRGPRILQTIFRIIFNGMWMLSKCFHQFLLPAFMVRITNNKAEG